MFSVNTFMMHFRRYFGLLSILLVVVCLSCFGGGKPSKEATLSSLKEQADEVDEFEEDSLVYDIDEAPLTDAVDESFLDFFYTFLTRKGFRLERVAYPIEVKDEKGAVVQHLKNGRSVTESLRFDGYEFLMLLLSEDQDPYDYLNNEVLHAEIQQVVLSNGHCRSYAFDRKEKGWMFTGIHEERCGKKADFVKFFHHFVTDSIFRDDHLATEIFITVPSDEDESTEVLEGNIDSGQWDAFAPELPQSTMLLLDLGESADDKHGIKVVKCDLASSMLQVLTFEREDNDWKLIKYEE